MEDREDWPGCLFGMPGDGRCVGLFRAAPSQNMGDLLSFRIIKMEEGIEARKLAEGRSVRRSRLHRKIEMGKRSLKADFVRNFAVFGSLEVTCAEDCILTFLTRFTRYRDIANSQANLLNLHSHKYSGLANTKVCSASSRHLRALQYSRLTTRPSVFVHPPRARSSSPRSSPTPNPAR
jgi:hypothetical protein